MNVVAIGVTFAIKMVCKNLAYFGEIMDYLFSSSSPISSESTELDEFNEHLEAIYVLMLEAIKYKFLMPGNTSLSIANSMVEVDYDKAVECLIFLRSKLSDIDAHVRKAVSCKFQEFNKPYIPMWEMDLVQEIADFPKYVEYLYHTFQQCMDKNDYSPLEVEMRKKINLMKTMNLDTCEKKIFPGKYEDLCTFYREVIMGLEQIQAFKSHSLYNFKFPNICQMLFHKRMCRTNWCFEKHDKK
jgi:hypothetical protein